MSRCYDFDHRSYYNLDSGRIVPIRSIVGQAQFFLSIAVEWITAPNEQLLLCRFANTIHRYSDEREVRQLRQLAQHLDKHRFEGRHGYVNPVVGREVEREIILRQAMDCAAGYDLTPAMRLLAEYERDGPVFSQPERNLLLRSAFCFGTLSRTREFADAFREKECSSHRLAEICRELEQVELNWAGLKDMDGLQYAETRAPGFRMSLKNCTDPMAHYPPFAYYPPLELPEGSVVLQNGVVLLPDQEGWWQSGIQKVDQTFTAPHFYKADGDQTFTISDQEYEPIIGRITFASGEELEFIGVEDYLEAVREELPYMDFGIFVTDASGQIKLHEKGKKLYPGEYTVTEVEPAPGYQMKEPTTQKVILHGSESKTLTFFNEPLNAIVVEKYDSVTHEALPGCTFQLKYLGGTSGTGGTVIGTKVTGKNGTAIWTGLKSGTYIVEVRP